MNDKTSIFGIILANIACMLMQAQALAMTIINDDPKPRRVTTRCIIKGATPEDAEKNCDFCYSIDTVIGPKKSRMYQCVSGASFSVDFQNQSLNVAPYDTVTINNGKLRLKK